MNIETLFCIVRIGVEWNKWQIKVNLYQKDKKMQKYARLQLNSLDVDLLNLNKNDHIVSWKSS